jgi:hypothetical protein
MEGYLTNNEFERMWKGAIVAEYDIVSRNLPGKAEETHEKPQIG